MTVWEGYWSADKPHYFIRNAFSIGQLTRGCKHGKWHGRSVTVNTDDGFFYENGWFCEGKKSGKWETITRKASSGWGLQTKTVVY
mmetsp:Transcript_4710/g.5625  ORF Transcript_4710/g.5625 Transcript_4710/m.5625 type:complete len:85 (+) Transcript_4710:551-805(+)